MVLFSLSHFFFKLNFYLLIRIVYFYLILFLT